MSKLRFGMIGAGAISNLHLPAIAAREDCEIVCLADGNLEQAKTRAEQYHVPRAVGSSLTAVTNFEGAGVLALPGLSTSATAV